MYNAYLHYKNVNKIMIPQNLFLGLKSLLEATAASISFDICRIRDSHKLLTSPRTWKGSASHEASVNTLQKD